MNGAVDDNRRGKQGTATNGETVQWNYDIPQPWTKEQSEAWEALIPRSIPRVLKTSRT